MNPTIILHGITTQDFLSQLEQVIEAKVKEALSELKKPVTFEYMNSTEVCSMLKISKPTLHTWRKQGLIKTYRISTKVYFRSDEIEAALENRLAKKRRY